MMKINVHILTAENYLELPSDCSLYLFAPFEAKDRAYQFVKKQDFTLDKVINIASTSEYFLFALNNCAFKPYCDETEYNKHIPAIPKGCIEFFDWDGDKWVSISKEDGTIRENSFNNAMKLIMDDFYALLNNYEDD